MKKALVILLIAAAAVFIGCAPQQIALNMKSSTPPPVKYCNDAVGHIVGAVPWILGGTCCCTPTEANFRRAQTEGTVPPAMAYADYLKLYTDRGIVSDLDHKGCNNRCDHGPHVVFGGHCMATPTPATDNYEEVATGVLKNPPATGTKK